MTVGIYQITNRLTGERYIGCSKNIERRFMEHKCPSVISTEISKAINKYGKSNFTFEILEECLPERLYELEEVWIARNKPEYNRNSGGLGNKGHIVTDKLKNHLSIMNKKYWDQLPETNKKEICERLTGPKTGHYVSEETREKLRIANLGKKASEETKAKRKKTIEEKKQNGWVRDVTSSYKPVRCKETGIIYPSVKNAASAINCNPAGISAVLKGRQKTAKGLTFEYYKED